MDSKTEDVRQGSLRRVLFGQGLIGYGTLADGSITRVANHGFTKRDSESREFTVQKAVVHTVGFDEDARNEVLFVCEFTRENGTTYTGAVTAESLARKTEAV